MNTTISRIAAAAPVAVALLGFGIGSAHAAPYDPSFGRQGADAAGRTNLRLGPDLPICRRPARRRPAGGSGGLVGTRREPADEPAEEPAEDDSNDEESDEDRRRGLRGVRPTVAGSSAGGSQGGSGGARNGQRQGRGQR